MSDCNSNPTSGCTDNSTATQIKIMNGKILPLFINLEASVTALGEAMLDCCEASGEKIDDINEKLETIIENNSDCCDAILDKIGQIGQILDVIEAGGVPCVSTTTTTAEPCYLYTITNYNPEVALFNVLYCDGTTEYLSLSEDESIVVCLQEDPKLITGSISISKGGTCTGTIITTTTTVSPPTTTTSTTSEVTTTTTTSDGTTTTTTTSDVTTTTTTVIIDLECETMFIVNYFLRQEVEPNIWQAYVELPVPVTVDTSFDIEFDATRYDVPDSLTHHLVVTVLAYNPGLGHNGLIGWTDSTYGLAQVLDEVWGVTAYRILSVTPDLGLYTYSECTNTTTTPP